jgi:hypothetical protein
VAASAAGRSVSLVSGSKEMEAGGTQSEADPLARAHRSAVRHLGGEERTPVGVDVRIDRGETGVALNLVEFTYSSRRAE